MANDRQFFNKLSDLLKRGWIPLPDYHGYRGTGGPGLMLNELLGWSNNKEDTPDSGKWEVKFHSGTAPLTLFHKTPSPKGVMGPLVRNFGWLDNNGRTSFRHTIWGINPARGFYVENDGQRLIVRKHGNTSDILFPYWDHNTLLNAFIGKMRRLAIIHGEKRKGQVIYKSAHLYWEPYITHFIDAITSGIIAIDFDARTTDGNGLRDHGTKFRIKIENIQRLYSEHKIFDCPPPL